MKCSKCGAMIASSKGYGREIEEDEEYEGGEGEEASLKDSVLAELIDAMQGTVDEDLKKPAFMAIEIKKKS